MTFDEMIKEATTLPWAMGLQHLAEMRRSPFIPEPHFTKDIAAGQIKLARLLKVAQNPEEIEEMSRAAMVDPQIQQAMDYQQAMAEREALMAKVQELTTINEASQSQMQIMGQQAQQAQQQAQQTQMQLEQMNALTQQAQSDRAGATMQAMQAQDQVLQTQVIHHQHRQQIAAEAEAKLDELKQMLGTSPEEMAALQEQQAQAQQAMPQQQPGMEGQPQDPNQQGQPATQEAGQEVQQAQKAQQDAQVQTQQAQGAMAQDQAKQEQKAQKQQTKPQQPQGQTKVQVSIPKQSSVKMAAARLGMRIKTAAVGADDFQKGYQKGTEFVRRHPGLTALLNVGGHGLGGAAVGGTGGAVLGGAGGAISAPEGERGAGFWRGARRGALTGAAVGGIGGGVAGLGGGLHTIDIAHGRDAFRPSGTAQALSRAGSLMIIPGAGVVGAVEGYGAGKWKPKPKSKDKKKESFLKLAEEIPENPEIAAQETPPPEPSPVQEESAALVDEESQGLLDELVDLRSRLMELGMDPEAIDEYVATVEGGGDEEAEQIEEGVEEAAPSDLKGKVATAHLRKMAALVRSARPF